jgi:hypothetical protein
MKKLLLAATAVMAMMSSAHSADIQLSDKGTAPRITINGELAKGDYQKFSNLAARLPSGHAGSVYLDSPGGAVDDALSIGSWIADQNWTTVVPKFCASSCALIWLAGKDRTVKSDARVGFHAIYFAKSDQVSPGGNAKVGAYLFKLGFSPNTIEYLTQTSPKKMEWLDGEKAERYGIDVNVVE